ncbi:hypothetical protein, partial [Methylobacterium sp. WL8]|uniref:hypothetical protein n=1 Tax=Methylobacterium sp. WL8 TaxID=2603899 RepID=UPI001FEF3809
MQEQSGAEGGACAGAGRSPRTRRQRRGGLTEGVDDVEDAALLDENRAAKRSTAAAAASIREVRPGPAGESTAAAGALAR